MSALASLVRAYERMADRGEVPPFGYSQEKIGFLIPLGDDGTPHQPIDVRDGEGKKRTPRPMAVPQPVKRTSGIAPNFLWDKTAYALGVTAAEGKRTATEHAEFVGRHEEWLAGSDDPGLAAFLAFLRNWTPEDFARLGWPDDMKDQNVVFALESERRDNVRIHDRPAARALWARLSAEGDKTDAVCLVSGERGPVARLHPAIKGVWGAQTAGASIVSFNLDAFTSYGHDQGDNAPVSEAAAFAYTTALNHFLKPGSGHRIQIGDASTVFWADAGDAGRAGEAEDIFAALLGTADEKVEAGKVGAILAKIRNGLPIEDIAPDLPPGVRFYILALAPNAARLSVRFYLEDDFGAIAARWLAHLERMRIDPPPRDGLPPPWRLLVETAPQRKSENVPPNLAGEWMRAILAGAPYPMTLLSTLLMRLRADGDVSALRVGILKSVLVRNFGDTLGWPRRRSGEITAKMPKREVPVSLDPQFREQGYLLGRLFATYEYAQTAALGRSVNATIKDKYFGAASSQPRKVFGHLNAAVQTHLAKVRKERRGTQEFLERKIAEIMDAMEPGEDPFPTHLPDKQQGLFALGYYHQRNDFFRTRDNPAAEPVAEEAA
jgi:CRISPR-associated protein Csd1